MANFSVGDVDGSQVLTDNDHLYPAHINELRQSRGVTAVVGQTSNCEYYCDGVADDVQIQAAITAVNADGGGTVLIKEGTYDITATLVPKENVGVIGEGFSTILKLANSTNVHVFNYDSAVMNNVYFGYFQIDGNATNQSSTTALGIRGIFARSVFENLYIHDVCAQAIGMVGGSSCFDNIVRGCIVKFTSPKATAEGIFVRGNRIVVANNIVTSPGDSGIIIEEAEAGVGSNTVTVIGNVVTNAANYGIVSVSGGVNQTISGNSLRSCKEGIIVDIDRSTISNNVIQDGTGHGILVQNSNVLVISGNTCYNNDEDGIDIQGSEHITVTGNTCSNNTHVGININEFSATSTKSKAFVVTGNTCVANGDDGIGINPGCNNGSITGNVCKENDQANAGSSGIGIYSSTDVVCTGNRCYDAQGSPTQDYGIQSLGTADYNIAVGNDCRGNAVGSISLAGANNVNASNIT